MESMTVKEDRTATRPVHNRHHIPVPRTRSLCGMIRENLERTLPARVLARVLSYAKELQVSGP